MLLVADASPSLQVISLPVALGLVLGANLGSGLLGMLSTLRSPPEARRVTLGNFLFKLIGCVLLVPLVDHIEGWIDGLALDPSARGRAVPPAVQHRARADVHRSAPSRSRASPSGCCPRRRPPTIPAKPRHLDPSALDTPALAIANAAREALRIGDVIEEMLRRHADGAAQPTTARSRSDCARWTTSSTSSTRR